MTFSHFVVHRVFQAAVAGYFVPIVAEKICEMIKLALPRGAVGRVFEKRLFDVRADFDFAALKMSGGAVKTLSSPRKRFFFCLKRFGRAFFQFQRRDKLKQNVARAVSGD